MEKPDNWKYAPCPAPVFSRSSPWRFTPSQGCQAGFLKWWLLEWWALYLEASPECAEPSNLAARKRAPGRGRLRVGGRRHEVLSHWFLTAVWGHRDFKRSSRNTCLYWHLHYWQWWVSEQKPHDAWWQKVWHTGGQRETSGYCCLPAISQHPWWIIGSKWGLEWGQILVHIGASMNGRGENVGAAYPFRISCIISWHVKGQTMLLFVLTGLLATQPPAEHIKPHFCHWFFSQWLQSEMLTMIIPKSTETSLLFLSLPFKVLQCLYSVQ